MFLFHGWRHPEFRRGAHEMAGVAVGIAAWGLITGVTMVKAGLPVPLAVLMSLLVYAGTAQLAAVPLMASGAPIWVVWATALCLNLRFVIFSTQWRPYLAHLRLRDRASVAYFTADLNYVIFMRRFPEAKPSPEQMPYFWGGTTINWFSWQIPSLVGIALGDAMPTQWGIGFAGTLALIGLLCSLLSGKASWVAAGVAGTAAVAAYALPLKLNIVVAIAAAVAVGLLLDHTTPKAALPAEDKT